MLQDKKFESYNNLRALYNFASNHPDICQVYVPELIENLASETTSKKLKIMYYIHSIRSKYIKSVPLNKVLEFYKTEYEKLF